ncbi:MAG: DUF1667 domain-containing protein [Clostridium sp.]
MIKELICISCPMGCHLKVDVENKTVEGNTCKRGEIYGINEITNPVRIITSTVKVSDGELPVLPVKTKEPVPKDMNFRIMEALKEIRVEAPIKVGDIIVENILDTGINIISTRNIRKNI